MNKRLLMVNSCRGFIGGVERLMVSLARDLQDNGWKIYGLFEKSVSEDHQFDSAFCDIKVAAEQDIDEMLTYYQEQSIAIVFVHKCNHSRWIESFQQSFKTAVFIHDHDYYCLRRHKYFPFRRINCPLPFHPFYCSICSMLLEKRDGNIALIPLKERIRLLNAIKTCNLHFVLSEYMKTNLVANGFNEESIRLAKPYQPLQEIRQESGEIPILLYVGQLIRGKGVDMLLSAFRELESPARLRIVGRGSDRAYLEYMCNEYGISEKVDFVDWTMDVDREYRRADIVIVPSLWQEPFALVGLEAFAHAKAVVGFDTGGISQWLKHKLNGILVPARDTHKLAIAIRKLLESETLRNKYGKAGYNLVKTQYNQAEHIRSFLEPLEEIGKLDEKTLS
jgi:glycosyltransferase involved in cell wall biosynthesis